METRESQTQTYAESIPRKNICQDIDDIVTYAEWSKIALKGWEESIFRNTEIQQGNPLKTKTATVKVVLVEPTNIDMERCIQLLYKNRYPELMDTDERFAVLEQQSIWKSKQTSAGCQKIIKITLGESEADLWDQMTKLREGTKEDEWVAMHHIERCTTARLRKLVEAVFHKATTKVAIYTNRAETIADSRSRERPLALILKDDGKTYLDIVKTIKAIKGNEAAHSIKSNRKTKNNNVLVTMDNNEAIHIRGLDATATEEEVVTELKKVVGKLDEGVYRMSKLRPIAGETQALTLNIEREKAKILLRQPYIRVGLTRGRMEKRINVSQCNKCWAYDHKGIDSTGPDRSKMCYKCGKEGHTSNNTKKNTK
ncbi:hypothetical protein HUJ05_001822 [Dendroctonus ponderosae]|nr:hypothetical protein HUJ05_001822 [Dendroctonus ponderosae]